MRLWTLHPKYLDARGLVALWREGLLARAVLRGETRGYRHHPQLERFRAQRTPRAAINAYLAVVAQEAARRGYAFDRRRFGPAPRRTRIVLQATRGQLAHEWRHLLRKLSLRSPRLYRRWRGERAIEPHPLFRIVRGVVEPWERHPRRRAAARGPPRSAASAATRS
ncbi:MAG TPA: pyrimidine dimer DNA glycosylase/endonuclease V [Steroidobacteraceae bacterium]|nr:pyrimidine dimer DNA glycosylase/endonuclease V [Steroidobacteraceae bacterium]